MNWDQIEHNWAAMTRRVRPDLPERPLCGAAPAQVGSDAVESATDLNGLVSSPTGRHGA